MNVDREAAVESARRAVARHRHEQRGDALAAALEDLATALIESGDVAGGARELEAAAGHWSGTGKVEREGSSLLLAASSYRLAGELDAAASVLARARALRLPERLVRGFELEGCEQELAAGRAEGALRCLTSFLDRFAAALRPAEHAVVLQRRAAAANACAQWAAAGDDFLAAARLLETQGAAQDAEAARLAAAAVLGQVDVVAAEQVLKQACAAVPSDGSAAARRGLVGGHIAMQAGAPALALQRFDAARQGALDAGDALSYGAAAMEAAHAAEAMGDAHTAYARLATAWATLSDKLGRDMAGQMVRPALASLRERIGDVAFNAAKQRYEVQRRASGAR